LGSNGAQGELDSSGEYEVQCASGKLVKLEQPVSIAAMERREILHKAQRISKVIDVRGKCPKTQ
jgi:hypothetical protein